MTRKQAITILLASFVIFEDVHALVRLGRKNKRGLLGTLNVPPEANLPPDQWFTQLLDHSDPANNQTWQQRYQVLTRHYKEGGPVFLMLSGEVEADPGWLEYGSWVEYATKYNALMFQLEHRFYGKSKPTSDVSVDNLSYLTSEQALADAAYFVKGMTELYNLTTNISWIVFGGSYAGNLAAWMRYRYPHLVQGAVSSSGPVLAKTDFTGYMEVVENSLLTYGENCVKAVHYANMQLNRKLKNKKEEKWIDSKFGLCDPLDVTNANDVKNLLMSLADNIAVVVQYNNESAGFEEPTITTVCDIMTNSSFGDPLIRYAVVNAILLGPFCLDYKYDKMIELLRNTSWESVAATVGERQWIYQTCTEFGYYQTSESKTDLFGKDFPLPFIVQICSDTFGPQFTKEAVDAGVNRTNLIYGGLDIQATNVVYVHGTIDPWHALGVTQTRVPSSPAILINGTAHCANMLSPSPSDPPGLTKAREVIIDLIGKWI